jgi:hypothetical protein
MLRNVYLNDIPKTMLLNLCLLFWWRLSLCDISQWSLCFQKVPVRSKFSFGLFRHLRNIKINWDKTFCNIFLLRISVQIIDVGFDVNYQTYIRLYESNLWCLHSVARVRSDDVGFNPCTQRHYRRLIYCLYTECFTTLGHNCRRWFPRSLWSKKFI